MKTLDELVDKLAGLGNKDLKTDPDLGALTEQEVLLLILQLLARRLG